VPKNDEIDPSGCIHRLFEAQAARTPAATAAAFERESLSYAELDARANGLARHLRRLGVGPESLVGLMLERSLEMIVGVLGVLKAGGAYVPLDPAYPQERLDFMWRDARSGSPSAVLLSQERLAAVLPEGEYRTVFLDGGEDTASAGTGEPAGAAGPDNLAYVIYTSGSTGQPKGVLVPHRGVVNVIRESERLLGIGPGSRVLQLASLGFDASALEIFTALSTGACLVLTRRETLLSGEALGRELHEQAITAIAIPPSLLDTVEELDLPALRSIIVGGEACSGATARRWAAGRRLVNAYAPTEATIYATVAPCSDDAAEAPPIGRPIAGMEAHLLDERGEVAPRGEVGELCLGGVGVARGYLNRPELTAERFVPNPFGPPGSRLYRSGDLARALPDGNLQFVGRADTQVKVRGHRIELGEIEAVLGRCPAVQTAAVMARDDGADRRLVAYVVRRSGETIGARELRQRLAASLPDYMVPTAFVFLAAMPMTPTGKVDRRALPAPDRARPELSSDLVLPATPLERSVARIWSELLGLDGIGVHDDLFELGGHSLLAAQIVSHVRQDLGVELPLRDVFDHPTVAGLAARLEALAAAAGGTLGKTGRLPPIERAPRDRPLPLSFSQERVWFLDQLAPGSIAYTFQFTIRFTGPLDPAVLRRALSELVRRHEVLRTSFPAIDGGPVQVIHPPFAADVPQVDLGGLPAALRELAAEALVQREIRRGFDVTRIPLLRWTLMKLAAEDHLLLHVEHHFVHDGWSLAVFLRELKELYAAFHAGLPSPLPEPPIQYADFAAWQRRWMEGDVLSGQLAYWKQRLGGSPPPLELPADRPRPRMHSFRGGCLRVDLPGDLYRDLRAFSRREGSTLFMTMLAAFYTLLYRYTGQEDIVLGSGIANRRLRETEAMIGMVVNTLVFRTALSGGLTFRELLARVRETTLGAHDHQDMPFEKIVEELQPDRDLSRNPLFQVLFSFHDAPVPDLDFAGLSGYLFERHNGSAKSDLNVVVKPLAEQRVGRRTNAGDAVLTMVWEYSGDLFDAATVDRMWGHYQTLLSGLLAGGAGQRLAELPLLTGAERDQLASWNETAAAVPAGVLAHRLFALRAERAPGALAVADGRARLTYGEVARRAWRLARRLRSLGVGPESVVGLLTGRSAETVVGAVGILAAGGAYLPLDPAYPPDRLAYMLEDSGAAALVVRGGLREAVPEGAPPLVELDARDEIAEDGREEAGELREDDLGNGGGHRLAYVIYTSGSTGRPKGVEISQAGLVNLIVWHQRAYDLTAADRSTLVAGAGFDASVWEIWPCLAAGASLHVPDAETRATPARLLAWMAAEGVTVSFLPTPLAEAALDLAPPAGLALRVLLTGGDRLRRLPAPGLPFVLVNHYGPTENTVVATAAPVGPASPAPPPIGGPIANTRVHLVDRDLRRVPAGVAGELLVAGAGLARGYRGRPELTAESFVPDPWAEEPGGRLYRTGDLARWLPDGQIEFLGRIDLQVKIRGYRIEPGEIEVVLAEHPAVREAVVAARPGAGGTTLVAYVVPAGEPAAAAAPEALRAFLAAKLPDYMVPAAFVTLAELPLTPNGKVDLKALPEPDLRAVSGGEPAAPRTPLEELLAAIWAELIGVGEVGIHDNFFKLGGHSLIATRLLSRVRDAVNAEVPLAALFEAPTVAGLARAVEATLRETAGAPAGRIPRRDAAGPAPLSFPQERLWFLDQLSPGASIYNIARAFRLLGPLDPAALERAAASIAARHEALRTCFPDRDGRPVQEIAAEPALPVPVVDLCGAADPEDEAGRWIRAEARRPFDLRHGPLLRLLLLRLAPGDHLLLLTMHHIVSDAWSMRVLARDLSEQYRQAASGRPADLPELPVQYADFAVWQRESLQAETLAGLMGYWKRQLAGAPPRLELPADRPRPPLQSFRGAQEVVPLPAGTAAAWREGAQRAGATPFIVLHAVLAALFGRLSGQRDVVLGSPVAGRNHSELEELIGFFVNTLVLRLRWEGDPAFRELLGRARQVALGAHTHQDLPFERLVAELAPERDLGQTPLFQVLFTLHSEGAGTLELPGIAAGPAEVARDESRFDLELTAVRSPVPVLLWRYDSDLFDRTTVLRMADWLGRLLRGALDDPERRLSELPLLSTAEAHQVLVDWNDTATPEDTAATLVTLFNDQVARTPAAVALVGADEELTYEELDRRAERVARRLRADGVRPEIAVGVLLERTPDLMAALLGILKAGGFYVPLDPAYPEARIAFMLEDSGARLVLTQERLLGRLPGREAASLICLDRAGELAASGAGEPRPAAPDNLAYLIYTSGSTGRPKGVAIAHRSAAALVRWARGVFSPDDLRGVLASTSVCFDLSVFELFVPLACGGTVVLADDALHLATLAAAGRATLINTVPSAMAELLRLEAVPPSVRTVNLAGEPLAAALVDQIYRLPDVRRVFDLYGPSEDTTYSTCALRAAEGPATIGRPVGGTRAYLLDAEGRPVPANVPGELYLGGEGLARGYLDRPELTAERFVPDPFGEPGGRLYRTGDLVRWRRDSDLEFLGRLDHQVKIRGFRIELGEIEACLARHPAVREAVVTARQDRSGGKRLVAYVGGDGAAADLAAWLGERLPVYMVPAAFVFLAALPRTPNGKVDRRALPAPDDRSRPELDGAFSAPESSEERSLAAIWSEVLGVERVGVHDDFFRLGGHSLLATQVIARVRRDFQVDLPLRSLFQAPTISGLLEAVQRARESSGVPKIPKIARALRTAGLRAGRSSTEEGDAR
jgi:amino acid adenylation domain-containing protein